MPWRSIPPAALWLIVTVASVGAGLAIAQDASQDAPAPAATTTSARPQPIADTEIGLAKGSVFDVAVPPVPAGNISDPGDLPPVGRAFPSAPPRVPHAVADFMPITREENWCVDCHMLDWTAPGDDEPTAISFSHYMNLRGEADDIGSKIVGARWVCVSCHLPDVDTPPLVENTFAD